MPLSDEQRSLLQLLLEGGQGYDDIASLLGVSSDEVRARARAALTEMGGADPDAQVAVSDFLLGKADPIGRADAVRHLQNDPEANALAARLLPQLRLLAPRAELPQIPEPKGGRAAAPTPAPSQAQQPAQPPAQTGESFPATEAQPAAAQSAQTGKQPISSRIGGALEGRGPSDPKRRTQLMAALVGGGLLLLVGVLFIAGVFGGDDDGSTEATASTPTDPDLTIVQLAPVSGNSEAAGQAVFAQAEDQPLLQINLTGLEPAGEGQNYIVWLYNSDRVAFPLARDQVGQNGTLTGAAPIPQQLLPLLAQFGCVDVSLASNEETQAALQQAVDGQSLPRYSGTTVLRGEVPTEQGQQAPSGADSQCERTLEAPQDGAQGAQGQGGQGQGQGNGAGP